MQGNEIFFKTLEKEQVEYLFTPLSRFGQTADEIYKKKFSKSKFLKKIISGNEQGATHIADGYARATGKVGVVICDSDTSATSTITGLQTANMDSSPLVVFICHFNENTHLTNVFDHIDHIGLSRSCTKHNFLVEHASDLSRTVREALYLATSGRPGTILVDLSLIHI